METLSQCNICHYVVNDNNIQRLPCGHAFHRRCITQHVENWLQNCPVDSCNDLIFSVHIGSRMVDKTPRYIIPEIRLSDKTKRAIELIANFINQNYEYAILRLRDARPGEVITENSVYEHAINLINFCIIHNKDDGTLHPHIQPLVDYYHHESNKFLICKIVVLGAAFVSIALYGFDSKFTSLILNMEGLFREFMRQEWMRIPHISALAFVVTLAYIYIELNLLNS